LESAEMPLILPASLGARRPELQLNFDSARHRLRKFAARYGWYSLCREEFADTVMIFDDKKAFNEMLLKLSGVDTTVQIPDTTAPRWRKEF